MVIMPVVRSYTKMLRRNLLYTGITRAKNFLILCGEPDVLVQGLQRTDDLQRLTTLKMRINPEIFETATASVDDMLPTEQTDALQFALTTETVAGIDPMIGMNNMSPYDFLKKDETI